ncbi:hypothetical protein HPB51_020512 [Rhipicephalus microplus]|uniref:Uncharacterized protein n=1 Tax=Rhipicephalus microplus TaxID=6941 RepID=A0A9J6EV54_RHIMP|nr:hypothetical protein HPB51_020512 [Rhipicephalus microplus]
MGERLTSKHQFPPDGLCNYIFYDSLYKEGDRDLLPYENTYTESLNTFLNYHRDNRHTTLGVGFAFNFLPKAEQDLKVRNPSPLEPFWNRGIFHAGVLDPPTRPTQDGRKVALATVKKINRLLDTQRRRGHTAITAIALPQPDIRGTLSCIEDLRELRFTPNLVILFGHYRIGDNLRTNCAIMPPTRHPDDTPPDELLEDYGFDVATAVPSLRKICDDGVDSRGVVSVTLKGRWAEPQFSKDVDFFKPCVSDINIGSFGRITDVCPGGGRLAAQLNYSTKHHAMITYISYLQRTFVYDDERALAEKLCRARSVDSSVSFGIAAYDIDFEDYENRCTDHNRNGAFSRLKALRKVVDYFNRGSSRGAFSLREFYASDGGNHGTLSVTLKVRWTEPEERDGMDFYSPPMYDPSEESFGSYTEVKRGRVSRTFGNRRTRLSILNHGQLSR